MREHIMCKGGLLGRVLHYTLRLEVQGRGSVHAHIILWLEKADVDRICNQICACVPAVWKPENPLADEADNGPGEWVYPEDPRLLRLVNTVLRKQVHICSKIAIPGGCCEFGHCARHFPAPLHPSKEAYLEGKEQRWQYYRPRYRDRNIVPYHPGVLLLWDAHMNLQRITDTAWSFYLLKYAIKVRNCLLCIDGLYHDDLSRAAHVSLSVLCLTC